MPDPEVLHTCNAKQTPPATTHTYAPPTSVRRPSVPRRSFLFMSVIPTSFSLFLSPLPFFFFFFSCTKNLLPVLSVTRSTGWAIPFHEHLLLLPPLLFHQFHLLEFLPLSSFFLFPPCALYLLLEIISPFFLHTFYFFIFTTYFFFFLLLDFSFRLVFFLSVPNLHLLILLSLSFSHLVSLCLLLCFLFLLPPNDTEHGSLYHTIIAEPTTRRTKRRKGSRRRRSYMYI